MLNFYPGPSHLDAQIGTYYQEAVKSGILEKNHRSPDFEKLYREVKALFHTKLSLPVDYELIFVSSATEAWEVMSQSFVRNVSTHHYNGAFGEKWYQYAKKLKPNCIAFEFGLTESPHLELARNSTELIALTHTETSNGTFLPKTIQQEFRKNYHDNLIAYDATSSMAGLVLNWELGDIWFASVQKCFGLPAGLGVMLISPKAVEKAAEIQEDGHYNSFLFMLQNAKKWQTHYTPNVANIFLLKSVLENRKPIREVDLKLRERANYIYDEIIKLKKINCQIVESDTRSPTVICLKADEDIISDLKLRALNQNILLGNGYGSFKNSTIRLANFPAIGDDGFERLLLFLSDFDKRY